MHQKFARFDFQSGHMPRLQVQTLVGAHMAGNQLMFLSHVDVSLSLPLKSMETCSVGGFLKKAMKRAYKQYEGSSKN